MERGGLRRFLFCLIAVPSLTRGGNEGLVAVLRDFCDGGRVLLSWTPEASAEFSAFVARALHRSNCCTVAAGDMGSKNPGNLLTEEMFLEPAVKYKLLFLNAAVAAVRDLLSPLSPLNSEMTLICELNSMSALQEAGPIGLDLGCFNVLVLNFRAFTGGRKLLIMETAGRGYWLRLWLIHQFSTVCNACGAVTPGTSWKMQRSLQGLNLRVGTIHNPPHCRLRNDTKDYGRFDGIELQLLQTLAAQFNFTFTLLRETEGKFGGLDGSRWSGMIGQVQRREVDVALGGLSIFYDRIKYVDFVYPYIEDVFAFVTKVPRRLPLIQAILYPFQLEVWLCLATSLAVGTILLQGFCRWTPARFLVGHPPDFWLLLATLFRQSGWRSRYVTASFRTFQGSWIALTFVVANAYSCLLLSVLSIPVYERQVDTVSDLEDVLRAGTMTAGTANGTAQARLILSSTKGAAFIIRQHIERNGHLLVRHKALGLQKALHERYSYIDTALGLRAAMAEMNHSQLRISRGYLGTTYLSMAIQKTCFYGQHLSWKAKTLMETGHLIKWEREDAFHYSAKTLSSETPRDTPTFEVFDLSDMASPLLILLGGFVVATIALTLEILFRPTVQQGRSWTVGRGWVRKGLRRRRFVKFDARRPLQRPV